MPAPVIGSTVPIAVQITSTTGALVNASTNTLTITQPDGTAVTPTASNPSTGNYVEFFVPTQVGRHNWYWSTTGPVSADSGAFDVLAASPGGLVSQSDFALYLNNPAAATDPRSSFILGLAQTLCETVITPLPVGAELVVLDVAYRAYANPTPMDGSALGLYSEGVGPFSTSTPGTSGGGLWLTDSNVSTLQRLAGGTSSGAFNIDTLPADYELMVPPWDAGNWSFG